MDNFLRLENRHSGEILLMRRVRNPQGQTVLFLDGTLPPGKSGPPLHIHLHEQEQGTVTAGTLGALVRTEKILVPTGGSVVLPAGVSHRWWNAGSDLLQFNGQAAPAVDLDRFLQAVFAVLNASNGRPPIFYLAHVLWRHRKTQLIMIPPPAIQRILFPVVVMIGRMLGKYRGSDWPGSPESCPGAPVVETNA